MSRKAIERVKKLGFNNGTCPFFNRNACKFFDDLNKEKRWNLQHALNGGEVACIGYSLDAYDKKRNIVVEYDEPRHYNKNGTLKKKDIDRMKRLIERLQCQFHRYNEINKELKQYA